VLGTLRPGHVLALNGGSSAGKSTIGRSLQSCLDGDWLMVGIDTLIWSLPTDAAGNPRGIEVVGGEVSRTPSFMQTHRGFRGDVAAFAHSGLNVILDEVLVEGAADQRRWNESLAGIETCWIGVRCAPGVAASREAERGDRPVGGAVFQALSVHVGVGYDLEVDTSSGGVLGATARVLVEARRRWSISSSAPRDRPSVQSSMSAWDSSAQRRTAPWER
jgi:chloramphenicol 3-O phosphotransferase